MKAPMLITCLALGAVVAAYVGSYFLFVSPVRFVLTGGDQVAVAPAYRYVLGRVDAVAIYGPIHLLDRTFLRRSKWRTRPAQNGELSSGIVGPRRVLFSVPYTNAP
jgi:hypothetical protein